MDTTRHLQIVLDATDDGAGTAPEPSERARLEAELAANPITAILANASAAVRAA